MKLQRTLSSVNVFCMKYRKKPVPLAGLESSQPTLSNNCILCIYTMRQHLRNYYHKRSRKCKPSLTLSSITHIAIAQKATLIMSSCTPFQITYTSEMKKIKLGFEGNRYKKRRIFISIIYGHNLNIIFFFLFYLISCLNYTTDITIIITSIYLFFCDVNFLKAFNFLNIL